MAVLKPYQQDIDARVTIPCNPGKRNRKHDVVQIRFIALYNALNDDYHTFFTNIPAQELSGKNLRVFEPWWDIWKTLVTGSISAHVTRLTHTSQWYL